MVHRNFIMGVIEMTTVTKLIEEMIANSPAIAALLYLVYKQMKMLDRIIDHCIEDDDDDDEK